MKYLNLIGAYLFIGVCDCTSVELSVDQVAARLLANDATLENDLRKVDAGTANSLVRRVWAVTVGDHPEVAERAYEILGQVPGIEQLHRQRTIELPHLRENGLIRSRGMIYLSRFKARWALDLLGEILTDSRPLETQLTIQQKKLGASELIGDYSNPQFAASIMGTLSLNNWPLSGNPNEYSEDDILIAKKWWQSVKSEPDSFFYGTGSNSELPSQVKSDFADPSSLQLKEISSDSASQTSVEPTNDQFPGALPSIITLLILGVVIITFCVFLKQRLSSASKK